MNTGVHRKGSCIHEMRARTLKANHLSFSHILYLIRFTIFVNVRTQGGWINKKKPLLVISLWLLTGSLPVSGQACGMSSSGSLLCFLFPPLSSCYFPWQTNNPAVKLDADCQGNDASLGERSPRSPHSCVKYYPCAWDWKVSDDHFELSCTPEAQRRLTVWSVERRRRGNVQSRCGF